MNLIIAVSILLANIILVQVNGHGRLLEPPNRSSLWRFKQFEQFNPIINYNDNELFCGGVKVQHEQNNGRCGECGDSWELPKPRPNENGGLYGKGVIVRNYQARQNFTVEIDLTAPHMGYFEFHLCAHNNLYKPEEESCFQHVLEMADGSGTQYRVLDVVGSLHKINLRLPQNLVCTQCILRWHYETGNTWGQCPNGTEAIGCGPQENFRACADIAIFETDIYPNIK